MTSKISCLVMLLVVASRASTGTMCIGSTLPVGAQWVKDEFNGGIGLRGAFAWEFASAKSVETTLGWANYSMGSVEDGPETSWKTYTIQAKFVHEFGRLGRFGFLYGAGAGWAVIDGKTDWSDGPFGPDTTGAMNVNPKILPFDHSTPYLVVDARVRAHLFGDRIFVDLKPAEFVFGFDFRGFAPGLGIGWRF